MYDDIIRQLDLNALYTLCFTVLNAGKDIQFPKLQFKKLHVPGNVTETCTKFTAPEESCCSCY